MIRLGGLVNQKAFGKFEQGKVVSNPMHTAFIKEAEGEDHEVSMANNSLDTIIKMATELKAKMGENEKNIPAWIQDHITNAENFISQASGNYHEYGDSNESVINEDTRRVKLLGIDFKVSEMNGRIFFSFVDKKVASVSLRQVGTNKIVNHIQKRLDIAYGKGTFFFKSGDHAEFQNGYLFQRNTADINLNKLKFEVVNESKINEMGPNDVHFKQVMSFYDKGSPSTKKAVSIFVSSKTNASRNQILDDLGDMGYNEILDVVDHFKLDESEVKYSKTITKAEWDKKPKDYKSIINGVHYMLTNDSKYGTVLAPVKVEGSTSLKNILNKI